MTQSYRDILMKKIAGCQATIGIVGLGYVGLPLALRFAEVGFPVLGLDIDPDKAEALLAGRSYIRHIDEGRIQSMVEKKLFDATTDFSRAIEADAILLCVPTPLNRHREPDLTFVVSSLETILPFLRKGQILSLESTTYPGTTTEVIRPPVENAGFNIGEDMFLVYSPEREDPGNPNYTTHTIPKVCGGETENCLAVGKALYESVIERVVPVSSTMTAEMTKLLENIYRSVNIGLVNELKVVADCMGIDIYEVIRAASTKPFGFTPFYPGPGLGGHCIPIDPFYLTWKAREYGINTRFIELAGEINTSMPHYVVTKIMDALNNHGKSLNGAKIMILGLAYKKNVDDVRESPSMEIISLLQKKGAVIYYSDPYIPKFKKMRNYDFGLTSVELTEEVLESADCIVIATNHDCLDYDHILRHARLIVDTRGVYQGVADNVVKA